MIMISCEWTFEDRLWLIAKLSESMGDERKAIKLSDTLSKIRLIASQSKTFLESNREQLLENIC